jgi:23S rRNA pseudouridine1911/1915/1917 synthase
MIVTCTDVIPSALESLQRDGFTTELYDFRDPIKPTWLKSYDAVFAKAVFVHATEEVFKKSLIQLYDTLRDNGIICLTFKIGIGEETENEKLGKERYFKYYEPEELATIILETNKYTIIDTHITSDKKWIQIIIRKHPTSLIPSILFEDKNILVINKPSGMVVHPYDYSTEDTLIDFLAMHAQEIFSFQNTVTLQDKRTINIGGIVHKLDRETSGVMVIAKNKETFEELRNQFTSHKIKKVYLVVIEGTISADALRINAPLGRNKKDYKQVAFPENPRGELREAITDLTVIFRNTSKQLSLVKLEPVTGRTHQLRAHMNHIGHPIVGDKAYGSTHDSPRIMLHASKLTFILNNQELTFEAPTPSEFIEPFE